MSDISFVFPQYCCVCMGPAESQELISASKSSGAYHISGQVYVPVCNKCKQEKFEQSSKEQNIIGIVLVVIGAIIGILIGIESDDIGWLGGTVIGGIAGAIIAGFFFGMMEKSLPVRLILDLHDPARMEFDNHEYHKLFHDANFRSYRSDMGINRF